MINDEYLERNLLDFSAKIVFIWEMGTPQYFFDFQNNFPNFELLFANN
jgi:hypothetical protein